MGMFDSLAISASGLVAERTRLDVIAENLANANTTRAAAGGVYRRKQVVLQEIPSSNFGDLLARRGGPPGGVQVAAVVNDANPSRRVYDPGNPDADAAGYIEMPNINPVTEMTDMVSATHSYEANLTAFNTSKTLFLRTFDVLR